MGARVTGIDASASTSAPPTADRSASPPAPSSGPPASRRHRWPSLADATGAEIDRAGRISVLPDLTIPGHPEVFAVGDMVSLNGLPGVCEVAMQGGLHAANTIVRRLEGETEDRPFTYRDLGSVAAIGRFKAICSVRGIHLSGFPAWVVWMFVHLAFLNGFGNRISTWLRWVALAARAPPRRTRLQRRPHRRRPQHAGLGAGDDRTQPVPGRNADPDPA